MQLAKNIIDVGLLTNNLSQHMHETAPTQFVQVGDVRVAYRRFGKRGALPLLLLNYFATNMDDWDLKIANGFAAASDVIIFDYPGIGRSTGATPSTVAAMTKDLVSFCRALGLDSFDIVGFSLGGSWHPSANGAQSH